ncbi:type III pantothenate kinase [Tunicatimonas pelagia]|uniref:type III pantothenate kinase n=1 Tax=Tunicatimonas pelagia TaxID=931531 RepID=UPI002666B114|nr:type III pantothenate kinase [Tunicatimonas pelagia]WKN42102.1 type III pantothenate kinase [Tunicatimonas pelagia]
MILAVDIGNSNIALGIYNQRWVQHWRLSTVANKTFDEYAIQLQSLFANSGIPLSAIEQVVMSSVVPPLTATFQRMLAELTQRQPLVISTSLRTDLSIAIDNPHELGTDLLANAVAGHHLIRTDCVVVDFGTALSVVTVSQTGEIQGVCIAPGLESAMKALSTNTAQLPFVPLVPPPSVIGKNTAHAIQSGIVLGYVGLVEGLVSRIENELERTVNVIATGGLAEVIAPLTNRFSRLEPWLTLDGLRLIAALN